MNHQATAAAHEQENLAAEPVAGRDGAEVREFFERLAALSPRWLLTRRQRARLGPAVAQGVAAGWTPGALAEVAGANTAGIRNAGAVLAARLWPAELPPPPTVRRPPWCGECDERTRMLDYDGDAPRPCPHCKPAPVARQVASLASEGHRRLPSDRPRWQGHHHCR